MGEEGDLWHRTLIDPALLSVLGSVRGLRVLDVGCGNGYLTRRLRRRGAARAVGVDGSIASIRLARAREASRPTGAEFVHGDAARLRQFADGSFDRVVANMALMDIRNLSAVLHEVDRLLSKDGRLVFSINHPCFDVDERSAWLVERTPYEETVARKVERYREERPTLCVWKISESRQVHTVSYHRTLATYSRCLRAAGLAIVRVEEPAPSPEFVRESPQGRFIREIPLHLVVEAIPFGRPGSRRRRGSDGATRNRPARLRPSRA